MATNEKGSAMAICLLLITAAIVIGLSVSRKTTMDLILSTNDLAGKRAFFGAEGGSETGRELLEQNIACPFTGFPKGQQKYNTDIEIIQAEGEESNDVRFWARAYKEVPLDNCSIQSNASIRFAKNDTYIAYSYEQSIIPGASLLMAEGYEGYGFSAAKGGVFLVYEIWSKCQGIPMGKAIVTSRYEHMLGTEEECHF